MGALGETSVAARSVAGRAARRRRTRSAGTGTPAGNPDSAPGSVQARPRSADVLTMTSVREVVATGAVRSVFQPIVELDSGALVAY